MARISSDDDSWKAGGVRKRDFRHAKAEPEVPRKTSKSKKKDTKTWCRGKVGREHTVKNVPCVPFNKDCFTAERCGHYRHYETKCVDCGMDWWNLPDKAKAQIDKGLRRQLELEEKWCKDGHLMDWESNLTDYPYFEPYDDFRWFRYQANHREYKVCAMCGKRGKSRRRRDT